MMQINPQPYAAYNTYIESLPEYAQQQDLQKQIAALSAKMQADPQGTTMRNALQANARQIMPQQDGGYGGGYGQQATRYISPEERNSMEAYYRQDGINQANRLSRSFNNGATPALNTQASSAGAAALGQPNAPAGGKGGNPTAQLPPPPNQDGTPGSWSTYI
jgi:hypothetical protein